MKKGSWARRTETKRKAKQRIGLGIRRAGQETEKRDRAQGPQRETKGGGEAPLQGSRWRRSHSRRVGRKTAWEGDSRLSRVRSDTGLGEDTTRHSFGPDLGSEKVVEGVDRGRGSKSDLGSQQELMECSGPGLLGAPPPTHLRKSSSGRVEAGVPSAGQLRKWNCVSVRVSWVCTFFR